MKNNHIIRVMITVLISRRVVYSQITAKNFNSFCRIYSYGKVAWLSKLQSYICQNEKAKIRKREKTTETCDSNNGVSIFSSQGSHFYS